MILRCKKSRQKRNFLSGRDYYVSRDTKSIHYYSFVSLHNLAGTFQRQYILLAFSISYFILLSLSLRLGLECFLFPSLVFLNYKLLHSLQLFLVQPYLLKLTLSHLLCLFTLESDKLVKCSRIGKCLFYIIIRKYNSYMASITLPSPNFTWFTFSFSNIITSSYPYYFHLQYC